MRCHQSIRLLTALAAVSSIFAPSRAHAITRCEVLERAQKWVDAAVPYSQTAWYTDPTSGVCCYRSDCSGFVAAVWGLPAPGNTTYSFAGGPWDDGSTHVISAAELEPGDALNYPGDPNAGTGHIMLYVSGDFYSGNVEVYEEYKTGTPATHHWRTFDPGKYLPIRFNDIQACCDQACGAYGCACVDGQCNGGYCPGTGCSGQETTNCAAFGTSCVDHQCSGGFTEGTGCTAKETNDCGAFGCACVDHQCSGGYCPGSGCTAKETIDCGNFGCGCVDHACSGGIGCSSTGTGCTAKETNDCQAKGCGCGDHACTGACKQGTGCTDTDKSNCAAFNCGCVDGQCSGGACPGTGCDQAQTDACSAEGKSCSMGNCSGGSASSEAGTSSAGAGGSNATGGKGSASAIGGAGGDWTESGAAPDPSARGEAIEGDANCSLCATPPRARSLALLALLALTIGRRCRQKLRSKVAQPPRAAG